ATGGPALLQRRPRRSSQRRSRTTCAPQSRSPVALNDPAPRCQETKAPGESIPPAFLGAFGIFAFMAHQHARHPDARYYTSLVIAFMSFTLITGAAAAGEVWVNSMNMRFAHVPAGEFLMGSAAGEKER